MSLASSMRQGLAAVTCVLPLVGNLPAVSASDNTFDQIRFLTNHNKIDVKKVSRSLIDASKVLLNSDESLNQEQALEVMILGLAHEDYANRTFSVAVIKDHIDNQTIPDKEFYPFYHILKTELKDTINIEQEFQLLKICGYAIAKAKLAQPIIKLDNQTLTIEQALLELKCHLIYHRYDVVFYGDRLAELSFSKNEITTFELLEEISRVSKLNYRFTDEKIEFFHDNAIYFTQIQGPLMFKINFAELKRLATLFPSLQESEKVQGEDLSQAIRYDNKYTFSPFCMVFLDPALASNEFLCRDIGSDVITRGGILYIRGYPITYIEAPDGGPNYSIPGSHPSLLTHTVTIAWNDEKKEFFINPFEIVVNFNGGQEQERKYVIKPKFNNQELTKILKLIFEG